jgi:hypothetical protein
MTRKMQISRYNHAHRQTSSKQVSLSALESLQFHCLNVAVSLLSKQDMQKILLNRAIQIEKTRLFKYLECCDDDFVATARKIKVISASQTELPPFPAEAKLVYTESEVDQHVFWRSYVVSRGTEEHSLEVFARWCKSGNIASNAIVNTFQITMSYRKKSGEAKITCAQWKGVPPVRNTQGRDRGMKNILRGVASDLGLRRTDTNLIGLMEMFYGRDVVHNWGSTNVGGGSFLDVVL